MEILNVSSRITPMVTISNSICKSIEAMSFITIFVEYSSIIIKKEM